MSELSLCPGVGDWRRFHAGDVSDEELERLGAHQEGCECCRALLASLDLKPAHDAVTVDASPRGLAPLDLVTDAEASGYEIEDVLGEGGMGRVWVARDDEVGRQVALKQLRPDREYDPALRERFLAEARVTGQLEHPGIVPVYRIIDRPGRPPAYAMRLIRGKTLREAVRAYHERPGRFALCELLGAFVSACQAVAYAHSRGVIHRDLKGENVVLGPFGEVVVLDWGLARVRGRPLDGAPIQPLPDGLPEMTAAGGVAGTPAFMAPEQARGGLTDERSDVYGLGAVLYLILTGRPPHVARHSFEVLQLAREGKVMPPRHLGGDVPRGLEAICLKALAEEPSGRYQGAAELALEVKHWLAGDPVAAYPEPFEVRAAPWLRRRGAAAAAAVLLAAAVVAAGWFAWSRGLVTLPNRQQVERERERPRNGGEQRADNKPDAAEVKQLTLAGHADGVIAMACSRDGRRIASVSHESELKVWDVESGRCVLDVSLLQKAHAVAFSPDGKRIVTADNVGKLKVWDARTGLLLATLEGHTSVVNGVAWSQDGLRIVSGSSDRTLRVWDALTTRELFVLKHEPAVFDVAFSPDGSRIVSAGSDGVLKVWDARRGGLLLTLRGHAERVTEVAFSPDGSTVASAGADKTVRLWDARTGQALRVVAHQDVVTCVAFSPDGSRLATGSWDRTVRIWDARTGSLLRSLMGHKAIVTAVAYTADGSRIVSGSDDKTLRVWDAR
jgi:tRNA A-37 threonylcarbamoyl transferase component Bud32